MPQQAEFDSTGNVMWEERPTPPTDPKRFQSAMFKDRSDLWPMKRRPAHPSVKPLEGQIVLFDERPPCADGKCKKKGAIKCRQKK